MSSTTGLVLFLAAVLALSACTGDVAGRSNPPVAGTQTLTGFVGSPSIEDATVTVQVDGGTSTVSARSGTNASYSLRLDKALAPPIRVQAQGGMDLLTGAPNDTVLSALSFENQPASLSVSHLSTLAASMAGCAGVATEISLSEAWTRLQAHTGLDFVAGSGRLSSAQLGALMRANLTLSETLDRTRNALSGSGSAPGVGELLDAIGCDLADNGSLDASARGADARLVSVFRSAEAGVLLEMISGTPYLDGQPADTQIDEALRQISGDSTASASTTPVPDAVLDRARADLALVAETFDDAEVLDLAVALAGTPAEAAAGARSTLNATRLTTLWSLPERVALTDEAQIDTLDAAMTAQRSAGTPVVSLSASRNTVNRNETVTLSWASAGARRCRASGDWQGARNPEGTYTTAPLTATSDYRLYCSGIGGVGQAATQVAVVDPAQRPVVSLSADDPTLDASQSTILRWTSSNATACTASGAWSGSRPAIGSTGVGPLSADADYTLTCTGPGGSDTATLRITLNPPPQPPPPAQPAPGLTFTVSSGTIQSGQSVTLSWNASNASSCRAGNGWSGNRATSGSETRGPLTANTSFSLTCTGAGGSVTRTRSVTVTAAPPPSAAPTLTFSVTPTAIQSGQSVGLSWSASNATSCQAANGWSGSRATSGSETRGPLTANTSFSLTCTGPGGSVTRSGSVTVSSAPPAPAPTVSLTSASSVVTSGGTTTLNWNSSNASACTASGGWSGSRGTSGSATVGPISRQSTFSLSCSGSGGTALAMVSISIRGSVSLNWVAPTENVDGTRLTDLAGYRIYYGASSRSYSNMTQVSNPAASSTTLQLVSGDYYVTMTALDGQGNESAYSNEVLKTVP